MKSRSRIAALAGIAASILTAPALWADVTPALDRVPTGLPVMVSVKNLARAHKSIESISKIFNAPDMVHAVTHGGELLKTAGLNSDGSAAVAVLSIDEESEQPPMVLVLPVSDYAAFAKALGGTGDGVESITFEGESAVLKNLGGGFAAMSPKKELLDKFEGKPGNGKAHEQFMGATGKSISDTCDIVILADMKALEPKINEMSQNVKDQMEMMAAMGGGGGDPAQAEMVGKMLDGFARDSQCGVIGLNGTDAGVQLDFGSQFKEGSEFAGYFNAKGTASSLIGKLPKLEKVFLFAMSLDMNHPGVRQILTNAAQAAQKDPEAAKVFAGLNPLESLDKADGVSFLLGQTPAIMGGLFLNTSMFVRSSDPAGYIKVMKESLGKVNGQTLQGTTYQTTFESGGAKVGSTAVDVWGMRMQPDPEDPMAAQTAQMQMMLFGPGGMGGYVAPAEGGLVMTMSKSSELMGAAVEAAKTGGGLSTDTDVKAVAERLPADRLFELQIGIRNIAETALGFMSMMGGGPQDLEVPQDLPPVGVGAAGQGGGLRTTIFVPTKVLAFVSDLQKQMGRSGEDDMMDSPD
jgi:hypothetical protein